MGRNSSSPVPLGLLGLAKPVTGLTETLSRQHTVARSGCSRSGHTTESAGVGDSLSARLLPRLAWQDACQSEPSAEPTDLSMQCTCEEGEPITGSTGCRGFVAQEGRARDDIAIPASHKIRLCRSGAPTHPGAREANRKPPTPSCRRSRDESLPSACRRSPREPVHSFGGKVRPTSLCRFEPASAGRKAPIEALVRAERDVTGVAWTNVEKTSRAVGFNATQKCQFRLLRPLLRPHSGSLCRLAAAATSASHERIQCGRDQDVCLAAGRGWSPACERARV